MVDVNLKVPALEKLIDYTASGSGAVAGPMLVTWKAEKEARATLIEAKGQADRLTLIAEARRYLVDPNGTGLGTLEIDASDIRQRIEFQEQKRQANIASTVQDAATELGDKEVPEHEPDPDWTARFFDCVQDVSSEDMRKLWAKLKSIFRWNEFHSTLYTRRTSGMVTFPPFTFGQREGRWRRAAPR